MNAPSVTIGSARPTKPYASASRGRRGATEKLEHSVTLSWESTYAVALELKRYHPGIDLTSVTLKQVFDWTVALPGFRDDPSLCNDGILASIFQDWYEEILHAGE